MQNLPDASNGFEHFVKITKHQDIILENSPNEDVELSAAFRDQVLREIKMMNGEE